MHWNSGSVCRDGTLFVDVCCDRCPCQDHANQFHLLPGRKHFGSVESLVHSRKNVVSYSRSRWDGTGKPASSRHQSKTAYNKHRRHSEIEFVTVRYLTFDSGELDYGAWKWWVAWESICILNGRNVCQKRMLHNLSAFFVERWSCTNRTLRFSSCMCIPHHFYSEWARASTTGCFEERPHLNAECPQVLGITRR